ncbi:MAG: M20/M25/M40 family metallo-hydrolase [Actinobacteria bacterium]|nr:M20/M25/M40 family metallo-hydrolase [Actinomycetota bacterium]
MTGSKGIRRAVAGGAVAVALVAGVAGVGSADPADDRFDDITGPLASTVVYPDQFGMDPSKVVVDPTPLLGSIDRDRAMAFVESLAFPRTAAGPESARQEARDLVAAGLTDAGYEPVLQSVVRNGVDSPNLYAELAGTDCPSRVFVIGGHYDSAHPEGAGADDNATGVAGMLELARALRDHPLPITVRFASWSYEEVGLLGAFEMATTLADEDADVVGAVSLEMLGYTAEGTDALTGLPNDYLAMVADPSSAVLARTFGAAAFRYTPEHPAFGAVIDPAVLGDILRSDHAAFLSQGFPALMATDTANFRNPNYHTVGDTPETLDPDYLAANVRTMLAGLVTYASSDQNDDGRADLCGDAVPVTTVPPSVDTTAPTGGGTDPTPSAAGAEAVPGSASYAG